MDLLTVGVSRSAGPSTDMTPRTFLFESKTGAAIEQVFGNLSPRLTVNPLRRHLFNSLSTKTGLVIFRSLSRCRRGTLRNFCYLPGSNYVKIPLPRPPACKGA